MHERLPYERHPRFRRLRDYLSAKAPAGMLPGRQHFDPLEVPELLPYLSLVEVVPQPGAAPRLRIRLAGTQVVRYHGAEVTGRFLDEIISGPDAPEIIAQCLKPIITRRPNFRRAAVAVPGREHVSYERMVFPLASNGEHVDMLIITFVIDMDEAYSSQACARDALLA
ncbi:MAG: PAS domain-containing protein [Proteobacteria bacterium]|nr:PAS domain-containing protein [Pseudomonadota bacterium]MBI3496285.1 PAS domain-containing protein [Pseudomonadota bacterium]